MSYTKSQLQHQKELEVARERIRNRKKRTRRLIQFGAIAESFFPGSDRLTPEEFQNLYPPVFPRQGAAILRKRIRT